MDESAAGGRTLGLALLFIVAGILLWVFVTG